jgi:predicted component of type VI protein secretion system
VKKALDETTALLREAGAARPAPPGAPRLVMLAGPDLGQRIDLAEGELTIGRESRCGVVLPLGGVSRVHCSIRRDASGIWLRDLGSTNGTRRNGETAPAHQDVRLQVGDLVAIGGAIFKLLDAESPESEYHEQVFRSTASRRCATAARSRTRSRARSRGAAGTSMRSRCSCSTWTASRT